MKKEAGTAAIPKLALLTMVLAPSTKRYLENNKCIFFQISITIYKDIYLPMFGMYSSTLVE